MKIKPDYRIKSVLELNVNFFKDENIKTLICDADATLIQQKSYFVEREISEKLKEIQNSGIEIFIASNGKTGRINKVFENCQIKVYPMCLKPLPFKLNKILKKYDKKTTALLGDQFFTDILCGKFVGIRTIMTSPYGIDNDKFIKFKRKLEKIILGE